MTNEFKGKKLLILGGNPETVPIVQKANAMGIKTIVASYRATDEAKKYAWKSSETDGMDVPGLITLARAEKVDGVLVGVADMLVPSYCKVCDALNLPCYATQSIVDVFAFKDVFKATCEHYGIHGIPEFYLDTDFNENDIARITFPVMVKPVDSSSGMGMTVCYSADELRPAVDKALMYSSKKRFIVERYMLCDDMGIYYTFKDGECSASCIYDRYTSDEQPGLSRVCLGGTYPSKHIDDYYSRMHNNALRMFKEIGIRNGVLMLSAFYENGEFYVYDTGFRLQGEAPHLILNHFHGYNQIEMLIRFALSGSEGPSDIVKTDDPRFNGKWAATLWFLAKSGTIGSIKGLENIELDDNVITIVQRLYPGDTVLPEWVGTEKQVIARLYLCADDKLQLAQVLTRYMATVTVHNLDGDSMLLSGFDVNKALDL